jgi:hypothetical protein
MSSKFRSIGRRELLVGVGYAMFVVAASWVIVLAVADWT